MDLEDMILRYHDGTLPEVEDEFLACASSATFHRNTVYSYKILTEHLSHVTQVDNLDDVTSAIARCVEYGFTLQLQALLSRLPHLVTLNPGQLDRRLLLRKINLPCYLMAKEHGFIDVELEKRITALQRRKKTKFIFEGPLPGDKTYWGYRHMLYYLRWNRHQRYKVIPRMRNEWWGNCL